MSAAGPAAQIARDIIEASRYLVLATADATGRRLEGASLFWLVRTTEGTNPAS